MVRMNVWWRKKGSVYVKIMAHATPLHTGMPEMIMPKNPCVQIKSVQPVLGLKSHVGLWLKSPNPRVFPDPPSLGGVIDLHFWTIGDFSEGY